MSNGQTTIELSKREIQVLEMVATGASNQEIARQLVISVNTVKVHVRNIFEKLDVQSRTEASLRAIQEGLVNVDSDSDRVRGSTTVATGPGAYLMSANPPLGLPRWQQLYLIAALLIALLFAAIPLLPQEKIRAVPELPVIYLQPTAPAPQSSSNGNSSRWVAHNPMPTGRAGLALVAFEGKIFAMGGVKGNNQATRTVEIYDPATSSWSEGASTLVAAGNVSGAILDNKIYVPGGCSNDGKAVDSVGIYDPVADIWSKGSPLPAARCGYGLATYDGKLYLFGGWNGSAFEDTVFQLSPADNRWQVLESLMPRPAGYVGATALADTIYIAGGYDGQNELNQTYAFNPETGQWLEKAPLLEQRGGLGLISSGDSLFAVGGGWHHPLKTSERYDPKLDSWTSFETPFANQWRNMGLTAVDTNIYAVGGWDGTNETYSDAVVSYQVIYQLFLPISGFNN